MAAHVISSASSNEWDLNQWTEIWGKNMCKQGQALNDHGYYWLTNNGWKNVCHRHRGKGKEIVLWSKCIGLNTLGSFCNYSTKKSLKETCHARIKGKKIWFCTLVNRRTEHSRRSSVCIVCQIRFLPIAGQFHRQQFLYIDARQSRTIMCTEGQ